MRAESDHFSADCLTITVSKNSSNIEICQDCNSNICSCNAPELALPSNADPKSEDSSDILQTFPPVLSDLSIRPDIKEIEVISNLEVVRDLEFHHQYINDQIEKFAITPILCHSCNDLSRHFLDPAFYTNELYVKNSKWILNADSKLTMDLSPYNELTIPIFDIRNINI